MIRRIFTGQTNFTLAKKIRNQGRLQALFCSNELKEPKPQNSFMDLFVLFNKDPKGFGKFNRKKTFQKTEEASGDQQQKD